MIVSNEYHFKFPYPHKAQETLQDNPYDLQLRLFNGSSLSNGRLEVYCNGQWGTVCSDGFGFSDADTACR